ncbi:hypothetical protein H7992_14160 [Sporosarcina sp. resist]|uniref:hypothetical protein n=1 Tax=Sporosarcina sp. resist TaxID=2762563 RepID=UPI00164E8C2E|nr:hypothetical protein [Sporosarcina sp. resist]QNK86403.1 hypothetical protein H7992_14160 [Sporosarcina sp. resist]
MRLRKVVADMTIINDDISNFITATKNNGFNNLDNNYYETANEVFEKMQLIELGNYLEDETKRLSFYTKINMRKNWDTEEINSFYQLMISINRKVKTIKLNLAKSIENGSIENVYAIKLPKYDSLYEVVDFGKELNLIFRMVIGDEKKVKLVGFDVGSEWYLIGFELFKDFKLFAEFMVCVYSVVRYTKQNEDTLQQIPEEEHEELKEYMKSIKDVLVKQNLRKLERLQNVDLSPEEIGELEKSLIKMERLIQKGTEVHIDRQQPPINDDGVIEQEKVSLPNPEDILKLVGIHKPILLEINEEQEEIDLDID